MIYLDNAATSFPKPPSVYSAVNKAMRRAAGNPSRGSHKLSRFASEAVYECREEAAKLFSCEPENVVLTFNATHSLNLAIKGLARKNSHILLSDMEHNSVLRPVAALAGTHGCTYDVYGSHNGNSEQILEDIVSRIRPSTSMIIANHASNVCGIRLPVERIGALCKRLGITLVVDASQSAGHVNIDASRLNADAICMPGHKGLYGPQGTGLLILGKDRAIETIIEGGSGANSLEIEMPRMLPERLEAGTYSAPLASGLAAGMRWVKRIGIDNIARHESELATLLTDHLENISGVNVYDSALCRSGAPVLFNIQGVTPAEVGEMLDVRGICVRCGLHCSPLAHKALGTGEDGAVRVSFGYFNNESEIRRLASEISAISKNCKHTNLE